MKINSIGSMPYTYTHKLNDDKQNNVSKPVNNVSFGCSPKKMVIYATTALASIFGTGCERMPAGKMKVAPEFNTFPGGYYTNIEYIGNPYNKTRFYPVHLSSNLNETETRVYKYNSGEYIAEIEFPFIKNNKNNKNEMRKIQSDTVNTPFQKDYESMVADQKFLLDEGDNGNIIYLQYFAEIPKEEVSKYSSSIIEKNKNWDPSDNLSFKIINDEGKPVPHMNIFGENKLLLNRNGCGSLKQFAYYEWRNKLEKGEKDLPKFDDYWKQWQEAHKLDWRKL